MTIRFLMQCAAQPWAMEPFALNAYAAMLVGAYQRRGLLPNAGGGSRTNSGPEDDVGAGTPFAASQARSGTAARPGGIAVLQVFGPIAQRASMLGMCEDGTGCQEVGAALNMAMADDTVGQVLMEFDTPGGSVFGVDELATQIRSQRATKPIVGVSNSMCASAGYYLMSQCSESYCTPGGMVGSIGVYTAHQNLAKALEMVGVEVKLISAGKFKTEGNPFGPLGDDAEAATQASVDHYYSMFTNAVAKGRGVGIGQVRDGMGQGRVLSADDALAQNMIDGVMTFGEVVKKMQGDARKARSAAGPNRAKANANTIARLAG